MPEQPISFGRITLIPQPGWRFFPMSDHVVGRRESRVGGMEIWTKFLDNAPIVRTHRESLRCASQVLPEEGISEAFEFERIRWTPCMCGGASFTAGNDFLRLWYVHQADSLVPALYACKADQRQLTDAVREIVECRWMINSLTIEPIS